MFCKVVGCGVAARSVVLRRWGMQKRVLGKRKREVSEREGEEVDLRVDGISECSEMCHEYFGMEIREGEMGVIYA